MCEFIAQLFDEVRYACCLLGEGLPARGCHVEVVIVPELEAWVGDLVEAL